MVKSVVSVLVRIFHVGFFTLEVTCFTKFFITHTVYKLFLEFRVMMDSQLNQSDADGKLEATSVTVICLLFLIVCFNLSILSAVLMSLGILNIVHLSDRSDHFQHFAY